MLKFLGRGSAFHTDNNCAFYVDNDRLILFDCPMSGFHRLRQIGIENLSGCKVNRITVLITHTHSDHSGGIGMLIHYCCYVLHIPVEVIAPCREVADDLLFLIDRLDGCSKDAYTLIAASETETGFVPILTEHSAVLARRCFGWCAEFESKRLVYTGDSNTLEPFIPYLTDGCYLYTEVSAINTDAHLYIERLKDYIPELYERGIKIFLMHLDNEELIAPEAKLLGVKLAPLYE